MPTTCASGWKIHVCVCVLCTVRICWPSWRNSHAVGFWQYWMLQAITCDPLIPSFISCSAQALCNPAPPFHPLSFHLITCFWMLLCLFPLLEQLEFVSSTWRLHCGCMFPLLKQLSRICVFHTELVLWVMREFHHHGGGRSSVLDLSKNKLEDGDGVLKVVKALPVLACLYLSGNPCVSTIPFYRKVPPLHHLPCTTSHTHCTWGRYESLRSYNSSYSPSSSRAMFWFSLLRIKIWRRKNFFVGITSCFRFWFNKKEWDTWLLCNELSDAENWGNGRGGWQTIISSAPQLSHLDQKPVFWDERLCAEAWSVVSAMNFMNDEHVIPVYLP